MAKRGRKAGSRYLYCKECGKLMVAVPGDAAGKMCPECGKFHTPKMVERQINRYEKGVGR